MILIDTSVLSLAFRRKRRDLNPDEKVIVFELEDLFTRGMAAIIGPIRQEILSGISDPRQFEWLRLRLEAINDLALEREQFVSAAQFYNSCRKGGVGPGDIDMVICAAAHWHDTAIFTTDPDFPHYARFLPIKLHAAG